MEPTDTEDIMNRADTINTRRLAVRSFTDGKPYWPVGELVYDDGGRYCVGVHRDTGRFALDGGTVGTLYDPDFTVTGRKVHIGDFGGRQVRVRVRFDDLDDSGLATLTLSQTVARTWGRGDIVGFLPGAGA